MLLDGVMASLSLHFFSWVTMVKKQAGSRTMLRLRVELERDGQILKSLVASSGDSVFASGLPALNRRDTARFILIRKCIDLSGYTKITLVDCNRNISLRKDNGANKRASAHIPFRYTIKLIPIHSPLQPISPSLCLGREVDSLADGSQQAAGPYLGAWNSTQKLGTPVLRRLYLRAAPALK